MLTTPARQARAPQLLLLSALALLGGWAGCASADGDTDGDGAIGVDVGAQPRDGAGFPTTGTPGGPSDAGASDAGPGDATGAADDVTGGDDTGAGDAGSDDLGGADAGGGEAGADGGATDAGTTPDAIDDQPCVAGVQPDDPCLFCVCDAQGVADCGPVGAGASCAIEDCCLVNTKCQPCSDPADPECPSSGLICGGGLATPCDDGEACTADVASCVDGACGCLHTPVADGTTCLVDENACTLGDTCQAGSCVQGEPAQLDDGNPCTTGLCLKGEVQQLPLTGPCNDGDPCSVHDTCVGGVCTSDEVVECLTGPCAAAAWCDPATGGCVIEPLADSTPCGDVTPCHWGLCESGVCALELADCADGTACTIDTCDEVFGCVHEPDDSACGQPGACKVAVCDAFAGACVVVAGPDATACEDGSPCTVGDLCAGGTCVAGPLKDCDDGQPCTSDICFGATGDCVSTALADGSSCEDGDPCTGGEACLAGACVAGGAAGCDDGVSCTDDGCDPGGGCTHTPVSAACDDGEACTEDLCSVAHGGCQWSPVADGSGCDDGEVCTVADTCQGGACKAGPPPSCDDGETCTVDGCDSAAGGCLSVPAGDGTPCDDGDACTLSDSCSAGECVGGPEDPACAPPAGFSLVPADTTTSSVAGSNACGAAWVDADCPAGMVVVGSAVESGAWMDRVRFVCAKLELDGSLTGSAMTGYVGQSAGGNGQGTALCPGGLVGVGSTVWAGDWLDALQIQCLGAAAIAAELTGPTSAAPKQGGGGGTASTHQCPAGYAATGAGGPNSQYPCQLQWHCTRIEGAP